MTDHHKETGKRLLNHRKEKIKDQTAEFTAELLRLSSEYADLEDQVMQHELSWFGLNKNGLSSLEAQYGSLSSDLSEALSVAASPRENLHTHPRIDGEKNLSDAKQLETALHSWGDLDELFDRVEASHDRIARNINAKRQERASKWIIAVSIIAVVISVISLIV